MYIFPKKPVICLNVEMQPLDTKLPYMPSNTTVEPTLALWLLLKMLPLSLPQEMDSEETSNLNIHVRKAVPLEYACRCSCYDIKCQ
jgi:hypothetical protein